MPCVVPKEWIAPPDHETADGSLLNEEDEEDDDDSDENAGLVESDRKRQTREEERNRVGTRGKMETSPPPRIVSLKTMDSEGRELPVAERAPLPSSWRA